MLISHRKCGPKFSFFDSEEHGEHNGLDFVGICKIVEMEDDFFSRWN